MRDIPHEWQRLDDLFVLGKPGAVDPHI